MKKAAIPNVFKDSAFLPAHRPNSMSMHMITARTTEASRPDTKAKHHNMRVAKSHFSHRIREICSKGLKQKLNSIQTIPTCKPDKASTCEIPATE